METGNTCCSLCAAHTAQYFCICQFPLLPLCCSEECGSAHTSKAGGFHYYLPAAARSYVTSSNYRKQLKQVLMLHQTQSKLIGGLSLLDAAVSQIEEAYQRQVAALTALKDQYLARVNQLKEAATGAFYSAVYETAQSAVDSEYIPQSEIAQWIWTVASKPEDEEILLFRSDIRELGMEELGEEFGVAVKSAFQSLAAWHVETPSAQKTARLRELERLKTTAAALEGRSDKSEKTIKSLCEDVQKCKVTSEKLLAQMIERTSASTQSAAERSKTLKKEMDSPDERNPESMSLTSSRISALKKQLERVDLKASPPQLQEGRSSDGTAVSEKLPQRPQTAIPCKDSSKGPNPFSPAPKEEEKSSHCKICNAAITREDFGYQCPNRCLCKACSIESVIARSRACCSSCGGAFSSRTVFMIQNAMKRCHVCGIALPIRIFDASARCEVCLCCVEISGKQAKCTECEDSTFFLRDEDREWIRSTPIAHACCPMAKGSLLHSKLKCGHKVCKIHAATLRVCHVCKTPRRTNFTRDFGNPKNPTA